MNPLDIVGFFVEMEKTSRRLRELQAEAWEQAKTSLLEEGEKMNIPMLTNPATRELFLQMIEQVWTIGYKAGGHSVSRFVMESEGLGDVLKEAEQNFKKEEQQKQEPGADLDEDLKRQIDELFRNVSEGN